MNCDETLDSQGIIDQDVILIFNSDYVKVRYRGEEQAIPYRYPMFDYESVFTYALIVRI